jgi:23S rRNA pseudouridine1911/1915/1917 synthase
MNMKQRLDKWIFEKYGISRTQATRLIDTGYVTWGTKTMKSSLQLTEEEFAAVIVTIPETKKSYITPENIPLKIIYEDADVAVVHKPIGMVVHPACGNLSGTLVNALMHHCTDLSGIGGVERPGIVHRIDKDTEGLLVVAKHDQAHQFLSKQFEKHTITRRYLALVRGNIIKDTGTITGNLNRSKQDRTKVAVVTSGGKSAVTHYTVVKRFNTVTLVDVSLETGRTHQIRVHFAHIGHPLIGDPVYNKDYNNKNTVQCLIAYKLGFMHPRTKKYCEFTAELPEWVQKYSG